MFSLSYLISNWSNKTQYQSARYHAEQAGINTTPCSPSFPSSTPPLITIDALEVGEQGVRINGVHYVPVMSALSQVARDAKLMDAAAADPQVDAQMGLIHLIRDPVSASNDGDTASGRPFGHGRMDGHEMKKEAQVEEWTPR